MDIGKKALGMKGRKGRPPSQKKSDAGSDDEMDADGSENQDFQGDSSSISSPFQTPDQPISRGSDYSGLPSISMNRLHSADRYRNQSPTPASRRKRAGTSNSLLSLRSETPQSPYIQQYAGPAGAISNNGLSRQLPLMSMLPGSMVDPALSSYSTSYSYSTVQTSDPTSSYDVVSASDPHSWPTQTDPDKQNPYTSRLSSAYQTPYATGPTSAPFQFSDQYAGSPSELQDDFSDGSNDGTGSDDEWVPNPDRKRRRAHPH